MSRKEELEKIVFESDPKNKVKAGNLIEEIVFLEEQMSEMRKLPFIKINPDNPAQQKTTPAHKMYKEYLQQYNNSLRLLFRLMGDLGESEEESPLRRWARAREEAEE